jgi:DNA (cytosine-5)-methyltransferase 1
MDLNFGSIDLDQLLGGYLVSNIGMGKRSSSGIKKTFRFADLFAGIGGMRLAFEAAGGECVYTSEWNKFSQETYRANFQSGVSHKYDTDITKVDENTIPYHDVLVGGFPCQPFSLAGVSKKKSLGREHGFRDKTQGTLFFDICRILDAVKPKAFLLENVKNLASHDGGKTMLHILDSLKELGYVLGDGETPYQVIDAQLLVPQHRERTFIVGFREDIGFSWNDVKIKELRPKLSTILHPEDGSEACEDPFTEGANASVNPKYILSEKLWNYLQDYKKKHEAKGNGFGFGLVGRNDVSRTLSARYHKDGSEILIDRGAGEIPRRLTPRECARLMGFDQVCNQVYGRDLIIPVSDTQAYRQFGNAVAVPIVKAISLAISESLKKMRAKERFNNKESILQKELIFEFAKLSA